MEQQKLSSILNYSTISKFVTKTWVKMIDLSNC